MTLRERLLSAQFRTYDLAIAVVLGGAGFLLNMVELQLGWGLHFIFGNALIFAFVRVLRPRSLVLAVSISSARSIFLWNHPWAWLTWTVEAAFIAYFAKRGSPVRGDVLYWVLIGSPLLAVSYGIVMDMDRLSLLLVIAKQATNGVLNVVIGELLYLAAVSLKKPAASANWPKMPIESFLMTILLAIILIPTTVYLYIDAPAREESARTSVGEALQRRLQITGTTIGIWAASRRDVLGMFAEKQFPVRAPRGDRLPESLLAEFSEISILSDTGATLWTSSPVDVSRDAFRRAAVQHSHSEPAAHLVYISDQSTRSAPQLVLIVPFRTHGRTAAIVAVVRQGTLQRLLKGTDPDEEAALGTFLASSAGEIWPLSAAAPDIAQRIRSMSPSQRASALRSATLMSDVAYGNALMSDLRDARMVRATVIPNLPEWQVVSIASLAPEVLKARKGQLQLFLALTAFMLLVTLIASFLSKRTEHSLRQLAQSAADLAAVGIRREKIDSLVIAELNEISGTIASASSTVLRERGALAAYQRRLNSISKHAPILVYALDVQDHKKGELVYASEAIDKILGYSRNEASVAGWWSHALHPEDYDRCIAVFSNLQPGKVIQVEYRLRHKLGHYVWVHDTLSVETNAVSNHLEAVGVLEDISERKAAAEQLLQADKMASLGRMISGTAHELNQPLNFIKMAASNLRERARRGLLDADRLSGKLDEILSQVSRASAIILQMRVFGRTPKEEPFPIYVKAAVDAVIGMVTPQLELDGTQVDTTECAPEVKVRALPVLLEQVLLNLILNANDAIRARHSTGDLRNGWIKVKVAQRDWMASVSVEDNGTGLSPDILRSIFEPFFTTKPPREGTGLGLPISYGIIRDLGGTIRAENAGAGARFVVELPLAG